MTLNSILGLLICSLICSWSFMLALAPAPKEMPLLKCELRLVGKAQVIISGVSYEWDAPDAADVRITNIADKDVDIGSNSGPEVFLDLKVKDPANEDVKTEPLSSYLPPPQKLFESEPYILKPGKVYECAVDLLRMVPVEKRVAGTYKVKAIYKFQNKEYSSEWIEVKWPFKNGPWKRKKK